jgi:solute carrier family 35 protein C2
MTSIIKPTLPDETTRLLPPSTETTETTFETRGGKGGTGANENENEKKSTSFASRFWPHKKEANNEGKREEEEEEEEDHHHHRHSPHRVKRRSGEDASQIHTPRKTMGTTTTTTLTGTTVKDGEFEDDANSQMKPPPLREKDLPDKDDDVVGVDDDENDDFENGKGTRGTVLLIDKDTDRENENDENEDTLNNKNVSTAYAQKIIDRDTKWLYMKCAVLATLWFVLSASLALYNKAIFSKKGFPAPLLYTSCQFFMQWLLATWALQWPQLFNDRDKRFVTRGRPVVPTDSWMRTILPVGFFMGLDIGLSNISLVYITVSFYTLTKTTSLIFTLFVSFITGMEKFSWTLTGIVVTVMLGEAAAVIGETQFNAIGFFICLSAAAVSAVRWVVAQKVMHSSSSNKYGLHHPVILLYHAMPVMTVVTFSFSCVHEQWWEAEKWDAKQWSLHTSKEWAEAFATVLFGACMAFGMTLSEFELLKTTSAITVMIIGTAKDLITIGASVVIYGDVLDAYNVCGLFLCLMGIIGYNNFKLQKMKKEALTGKTGDIDDGLPLPVFVSKSSAYNKEDDDDDEDDIFRQTFVR